MVSSVSYRPTQILYLRRRTLLYGRLHPVCRIADNILMLSSGCHGLQSMLNICADFGNKWDILFNVAMQNTMCMSMSYLKIVH